MTLVRRCDVSCTDRTLHRFRHSSPERGPQTGCPPHAPSHRCHAFGAGRVDLPTVKRISGHKTKAMVERYAHQSGSHITEAVDKLDGRYRPRKWAGGTS